MNTIFQHKQRKRLHLAAVIGLTLVVAQAVLQPEAIARDAAPENQWAKADFHDAHFHLTNYIQEGTNIKDFISMLGTRIGRSTLFGIPLQQQWSHGNTGDYAPYYYLQSDAPLYYYSFTDAHIAMAYKSLPPEQQARLDPMITGFNPADMYAADLSRCVFRHWRVHHSQGVCLIEDRWRSRQPDQSGAGSRSRLRR